MLIPVVEIDMLIEFDTITTKFVRVLKQMSPFGPENPKPVFEARNVYVSNSLSCFRDRHIRFLAKQPNNENAFQVLGFDMAEHYDRLPQAIGSGSPSQSKKIRLMDIPVLNCGSKT